MKSPARRVSPANGPRGPGPSSSHGDMIASSAAFTLSPLLAFNQDVNGTSPGPGGNFIDGRKSITVGVQANYLDKWTFDLNYTNYFGGGEFNLLQDRDFASFVVKYSF